MNLENLTVVELKAMMFDEEQRIKVCEQNLRILANQLQETLKIESKSQNKEISKVKEKKEVKK